MSTRFLLRRKTTHKLNIENQTRSHRQIRNTHIDTDTTMPVIVIIMTVLVLRR